MIIDGIEYKKCPACERICLALEITSYGICKDCLIEKMKCCENCAKKKELVIDKYVEFPFRLNN